MGVAKSLRKAGHLGQLGEGLDDLGTILENKKKKKEKQDFINNVIGLYDNWKTGQEQAEQKGTIMQEGKTVNNVFSPENLTTNQQRNIMGADKKPEMNLDVNVPQKYQDDMQGMAPVIPETKTRKKRVVRNAMKRMLG
jgi:CRISPR/Cas system CSM-associated protein Csm2 small subunit